MKIKKILSVFMAMLTIFSILSVNAYALNWDGSSAGGSTNAVNGSSTGYVIRSTTDDYCVVGYRFSVVNSAGNLKVNKVIDVYRNSTNGDNAYSTSAKFSTKYNKKQLIANKDAKLKTTSNTTNCYKEKDMGFVSKLPNPSGVKTWQAYETNINKILTKIGVGTVSNMSYGDKVIIEPLFDVCLAGEYQALTVTEIAYCGRSVLGGSSTGGTSTSSSKTWGFIKNYTNRIWPNKLFTPDGQGLWTKASKIADGTTETFNNILTMGYGAGIAYTETTAPVLTICYDCYGSSVKSNGSTTDYKLGDYNRILSTTKTNKTIAGTKNVLYHTLKYDEQLGTNGLYNYATFGLTSPTGYKFKCWHGANGDFDQDTRYKASQLSNDIKNGDTYEWLSAKFEPITYSVRFNGNGNTSGSMSNESFTYDTAKALTANAFKRQFTVTYNYNGNGNSNSTAKATATFNGWAKTASGSAVYTDKQSVKNLSSTQGAVVDIYAKWTDGSVTLPTPTRTGYIFSGWYTAVSGGTKIGDGGDKYTPSKDITVYAHWSPVTYTVKYYLDGVEQTSLNQTCTYGTSYKYSSLPIKTGYTISGWWSGSNSSSKGNQYTAGSSFSNLTLTNNGTIKRYAYSTANTYTVQYYLDGIEQTTLKQTCSYGTSYKYRSLPTKTGYTISGWWSGGSSSSKGTQYTASSSFSNLTSTNGGTIKRYAYSDSKSYTVSYYLDGIELTALKQTCTYGTSYKYPSLPTKTGYTISGWWSDSSSTSKGTQYAVGTSFSNLTSTNGGSIKRYAYSTPITYEVKFNGNGSTSGTMNNQKFTYDVAQNLTANAFKREFTVTYNYNGNGNANTSVKATATFNGWARTSAGTKTFNNKQNVINIASIQNTVVNIYAKWTDGSITLPTPTRTGYVFDGWYTTATGTTKIGNGGDKYTPSKNITVYAHWKPITYTVSYYLDGVEQTALKQTCSYDSTYKYPSLSSKTGYTISGWWSGSSVSSKGTQYAAGASFSNITSTNGGTIKRYAYSTANTYTVQYYLDGIEQTALKKTCTYGTSYKYPSLPTKTGYTISGWWSGSSASSKGTQYASGGSFSDLTSANGGTVKRYAYSDSKSYTVIYYLDGVEQTALKQTCSYDSTYKYPSLSSKTGYTISGWWSGSSVSSKGTQYAAGGSFKNLTSTDGSSVKRYAYSTPVTYEVKFNGNGATSGTMNNQKFTYDVAQDLTANAYKRVFTVTYDYANGNANSTAKATATFNGWAKTANGSVAYTNKQNVKNISSTNGAVVNVYAKWTDGSITLPTPTRTGYVFGGWYTSASGTTKIGNGGDKYTPSKDITVYAHWTPITYTIKFDGNGSTSGSTASMAMTYDVAKNLTANGFARNGYKFVKWNLESDGTSTDYTNKQSVKNLTTVNGKEITMYAQWEEIQSLRLEMIEPNADYREGTEVISSFNIINEGSTDCIPDNNVSVIFKVYKNSTVIKTVTIEKVVVPAKDKNLLYFKWTVPENLGSATIYISGEIVINGKSDSLIKNAYSTCKYIVSSTPDTQFEYSAPENFSVPTSPANSSTTAKWSEWKYENGAFKKYNYGIGISDELPSLVPAASANASLNNGMWTMKSGYGVEITLANGMKSVSGYTMPDSGSYTVPQYSTVMFPEFSFLNTLNNFRTLELVNNKWIFRENGTYGRIHFTPLWYPDGFYSVNVVQSDCWTPAGMISRTINTKDITINGSAYDDWFIS